MTYFSTVLKMMFPTIIVLFSFIFVALAHKNATLEDSSLSWINATTYCRQKGLIMESNVSVIKNLLYDNGMDTGIWLGKYEEFTDWAYIKGCYKIDVDPSSIPMDVRHGSEKYLCQSVCKDQKYFGIKDKYCICLEDIAIYTGCECNKDGCVTIWEHKLKDYDPKNYRKKDSNCIVAYKCSSGLVRMYKSCTENYRKTCDGDYKMETTEFYNQEDASNYCFARGSFLKWHTQSDCPLYKNNPHWTSGRRDAFKNVLRKNNVIDERRLLKCFYIEDGNIRSYKRENCRNNMFRFSCRKENSNDLLHSAVIQHGYSNKPNDGASKVSVALGTVVAVVAVIVGILVVLIFLKRRRKESSENQSKSCYCDNSISLSSKSMHVSYSTHALQNQIDGTTKTDRHSNRFPNNNENSENEISPPNYCLAKPIRNKNQTDTYSFAQSTEPESDYAYNLEYDHLNRALKRANESDYTVSTNISVLNNDKIGTYDHLSSVDKKTDLLECSNYDHLPTNTGSDPTYDVSVRMTHDDGDKYDHVPFHIISDPNSDYQSTRVQLANDTTDDYNSFNMNL